MKEPDFDAAYREAKRAAFSQAIARLHQMSSAAASTGIRRMRTPSAPMVAESQNLTLNAGFTPSAPSFTRKGTSHRRIMDIAGVGP
jgi:hypothetical protein